MFRFQLEDNGYNLKLYSAVLKAADVHYSMDESYEDYQKIYDKTVDMQMEKEQEMIADDASPIETGIRAGSVCGLRNEPSSMITCTKYK